jgi:cell division protein FtsB
MPDERQYTLGSAGEGRDEEVEAPAPERDLDWRERSWRPLGTAVAVGLALLISWHVVNGKHGLSVWHQMRAEDQQLRAEIDDLEKENAHLRAHVERLKTDPDAIETEARKQLHYTRPGEVVYVDPAPPQTPAPPPAKASKQGVLVSAMGVVRDVFEAASHLFDGGPRR